MLDIVCKKTYNKLKKGVNAHFSFFKCLFMGFSGLSMKGHLSLDGERKDQRKPSFFLFHGGLMEKLELAITTRRNVQSVSARELHEKLESPERFSKWWKRFSSYGFEENVDYVVCTKKTVANQHGGEKEFTDYAVSVDMAKQICMLQRNEKGMEYRRYLLDVERRYKEKQTLEYKKAREKSIETRNGFTGTLQRHGYTKQYEYINTTRAMKKPLGITAKKNEMTKAEVMKITAAEYLAEAMLADEQGYKEVNPVCVEASTEIERILGNRKITA